MTKLIKRLMSGGPGRLLMILQNARYWNIHFHFCYLMIGKIT